MASEWREEGGGRQLNFGRTTPATPGTEVALKVLADGTLSVSSGGGGSISTMTHSVAAIGTSSTQVIAANSSRLYLLIVNDSDDEIYINIAGGSASLNQGILLNGKGASYEISSACGNLITGAITGITATGTKNLLVTEGV